MNSTKDELRAKLIDLLLTDRNFAIDSSLLDELLDLFAERERLARVDELNWLRSRYTAFTWGHYDPFTAIDDRLSALQPSNKKARSNGNSDYIE